MTTRLESAIEALRGRFAGVADDPARRLARVELARDGAVVLTLDEDEGTRWFVFDGRGLVEAHPSCDRRLPVLAGRALPAPPLAYRPGRRIVFAERRDRNLVVVKGYRGRRSEAAAQRHRVAEDAAARSGLVVPALLAHDREREALEFAFLEGEEIRLAETECERFFRIGSQLRILQAHEGASALDRHAARDEAEVLDRFRAHTLRLIGRLPLGWEDGRRRLLELVDRTGPTAFGLCHRDLHDGQLLALGREVALLDHDLLCRAELALDPANLLAHLALRALQGIRGSTHAGIRALGEAFLEGFDADTGDGFWVRLRLYESFAFLRLALLYSVRPRWSTLAPKLVGLSDRCLADVATVKGAP